MKIYLASKSPRRGELLRQMGVEFERLDSDVVEEIRADETAAEYSARITADKLKAAWDKLIQDKLAVMPVLCADTEVVLDNRILGKPKDYQDAFSMLKSLSGRSHRVITSVGLKHFAFEKVVMNITTVYFASLPEAAIHTYLAMGDYQDKAGSYGIQSYMGQYISNIEGCFYAVMGLPLNTVRELLVDIQR